MSFKLIPQLERSVVLVRWAQHPLGKVILFFCFGLLLYLARQPFWLEICFALAGCLFFSKKIYALALANVAFWIFAGSMTFVNYAPGDAWAPVLRLLPAALDQGSMFMLRAAVVAAFLTLSLLLVKMYRRFFRQISPVVFLLVAFLLLTALPSLTPVGFAPILLWGLALIFAKSFWYFASLLQDQKIPVKASLPLQMTASFIPFWSHSWSHIVYVPENYTNIERSEAHDADLAKVRLRGMKLLLWCLLLKFIALILTLSIFDHPPAFLGNLNWPSLRWPHPAVMSLERYNDFQLPLYKLWISLWVRVLDFLLVFAADTGMVVSVVRMAGFDVFRQVYKPLQATSFLDFVHRVYYYYIEILTKFFFYPLWKIFRPLPPGPRKFLTTFLTIAVGGMLMHILRELLILTEHGWTGALELTASRAPYFLALGLACAVSSLRPRVRSQTARVSGWIPKAAFYFLIYSLCFALQIGWKGGFTMARASYFYSLIGLH